jgi:hypothetical protein
MGSVSAVCAHSRRSEINPFLPASAEWYIAVSDWFRAGSRGGGWQLVPMRHGLATCGIQRHRRHSVGMATTLVMSVLATSGIQRHRRHLMSRWRRRATHLARGNAGSAWQRWQRLATRSARGNGGSGFLKTGVPCQRCQRARSWLPEKTKRRHSAALQGFVARPSRTPTTSVGVRWCQEAAFRLSASQLGCPPFFQSTANILCEVIVTMRS